MTKSDEINITKFSQLKGVGPEAEKKLINNGDYLTITEIATAIPEELATKCKMTPDLPQNHRQGGILVNQNWNKDYELKYLQVRICHLLDAIRVVEAMYRIRPALLRLSLHSSSQEHQ